ncbi:MAG: hypothetical protein ACFFD8_03160, partial [Candidatus Thorarchaeota archaeon]
DKGAFHYWATHNEAMQERLKSKPPDPQKIDARYAHERAEARFFQGRNRSSVNRSAFHITKMLKRQSG